MGEGTEGRGDLRCAPPLVPLGSSPPAESARCSVAGRGGLTVRSSSGLKPWCLVSRDKRKRGEEAGKRHPGGSHTGEAPPHPLTLTHMRRRPADSILSLAPGAGGQQDASNQPLERRLGPGLVP